jgi:hypothetical protein
MDPIFLKAVESGDYDKVRGFLTDPSFDPSAQYNEALVAAVVHRRFAIVERLLDDPRVDPSIHGNMALMEAIVVNKISLVNKLLADSRVNPSTHGNRAIRVAMNVRNSVIILKLLEDPRIDPTTDNSMLVKSIILETPEVIVKLLQDPRVVAALPRDIFQQISAYQVYTSVEYLLDIPHLNLDDSDHVFRGVAEAKRYDIIGRLLKDPRVTFSNKVIEDAFAVHDFKLIKKLLKDSRMEVPRNKFFSGLYLTTQEELGKYFSIPKIRKYVLENLERHVHTYTGLRPLREIFSGVFADAAWERRLGPLAFYHQSYIEERYENLMAHMNAVGYTERELVEFTRRDDYALLHQCIVEKHPLYNTLKNYVRDEDNDAIEAYIRKHS